MSPSEAGAGKTLKNYIVLNFKISPQADSFIQPNLNVRKFKFILFFIFMYQNKKSVSNFAR